jgi:uncharacterized protein
MDYVIVAAAAISVSALTLFSGFGLGTVLLPVFALFFPVEGAVAATAVVHGANNAFKLTFMGKYADKTLVIRFGIPAILAAFAGAAALGFVAHAGEIASYQVGAHMAVITPVKLVMGMLMITFALFELLPRLRDMTFERKHLVTGGIVSGFFGGFSGHQGALRSAFLAKAVISPKAFVGTGAAIGFMVDAARIFTYGMVFFQSGAAGPIDPEQWPLIITGIVAAFAGVMTGTRLLRKITMKTVRIITGILLVGIALGLGSGIV